MRDKIVITITDIHGSKHFTLNKFIKKIFFYTFFFTIFLLILSASTIYYLSKKVELFQREITLLEEKKNYLQSENKKLLKKIQTKFNELEFINEKIKNIEELLGIKPIDGNLSVKVKALEVDAIIKKIMLQLIPNGSPVPYKGITSKYGMRIHPVLKRKEFHRGIDLRASYKTPVYAPADGVVEFAGYHKKSGFGVLLIINHNYGFKTLYGHLYKCKVKMGDFVKKGDVIAYTGNSGLSSGPHLHYEVRYLQIPLNPIKFIKWDLKNFNYIFKKEKVVKWDFLINQIRHQYLQIMPLSLQSVQK